MSAIRGIFQNGRVVLNGPPPADWVEGTEIWIRPVDPSEDESHGVRDEDWPTTPEGIAELLKKMDEVEGSWLSPEDEAEWMQALAERKAWELANWEKHSKDIESLFQ